MKSNKTLILLGLAVLLLTACGSGLDTDSAIATGVAQTQQISALETAAAGAGTPAPDQGVAPADPVDEEEAAPTDTPTITNTPTPDIPQVSVSQDTNCRTGPASAYGYKATISPDQLLEVVGVWAAGDDYVIVDYSGGLTCWLWTRYADNSDFSAYDLPAFNTPATPTPTYTPTPSFDWSGAWGMWINGDGPIPITFVVSGNSVTGTYNYFANITVSGTITNGGQNLSGTWISDFPANGTFQFQIKSGNLNQFVGNLDAGIQEWCGARNGASQPSPCQWP
jgi:hypothetical protein